MSNIKWVSGNEERDLEFEDHFTRLVGLGVTTEHRRARIKKAWIEVGRPPIVSFIRQNP